MRRLRHVLFRFFLLALLFAPPPPTRAERLPIKIYTSADGLGSGFIDALTSDSRGFMWFCTRDGLSRFDGAQFVTFQIGDETSPPGVETIYETRNGIYWVGTTGGLYRFDPATLSTPKISKNGRPILDAQLISKRRGSLLEDREGNLWFASDGLYRIRQSGEDFSFQRIELNLPPEFNHDYGLANIQQTEDGCLWFSTTFGTVRRLPDGRVIFYPFKAPLTEGVLAVMIDKGNRVWLERGMELFVVEPEPLESLADLGPTTVRQLTPTKVVQLKADEEIKLPSNPGEILQIVSSVYLDQWGLKSLYVTSDGHVWLTTQKDLFEYDESVFHRYGSEQGLTISMVRMAEDAAGNLWIGGRAGLVRLDRKGLISYGLSDGLNSAEIFAINQSPDGSLYVANGDFFLSKFDGHSFQTASLKTPAGARSLWTSRYAFLDSKSEWWVLTTEGLLRFAPGKNFDALNRKEPLATYTTLDRLNSNAIFQIFEDRRGDIWVSTRGAYTQEHGLSRFNRVENRFYTFTDRENFPSGKSASSFVEDNQGNLWTGFYEGELARYKDGRFTLFKKTDGLPGGVITDLHIDRAGRLWISSSLEGLYRLDDTNAEHPKFTSYTTDDGLSSNNIRTITEDLFGNIYAGTVRGVDRLSPATGRLKHFSVGDGLASDFVVDSYCDKNGVVWFATTNGLSRLAPMSDDKPALPSVWLGGLSISGLPQPISEIGNAQVENLELSASQNNVRIDFFGLDFRSGETLRYQYMLVGADRDWSASNEQRTVTYANLQPGSYQFLVRAVNTDGEVSLHPASVRFKILPPIWRRWWFITLAALMLGSIALVFVRSRAAQRKTVNAAREERLRDLERVRKHIATDLHDDIGSSLTQISILSEVVLQQTKITSGSASQALTQIASSSRELVDTMSDIVWAVNPQKDRFEDLIQRMRRFASDVLEARNIELAFDAPENENFSVGANVRREILLIFKECLNNIIKHSGCSKVVVEIKRSSDNLSLLVYDDGRGFNTARDSEGHGLMSMNERARALGGMLQIDSGESRGTTLRLKVPLSFQDRSQPDLN